MLKYTLVNWAIQISRPSFVASKKSSRRGPLYPYKAMKISFETSPNKFSFLLCLQ